MLKVRIVQQFFVAFCGKAGIGKLLGHPDQGRYQRCGPQAIRLIFLRRAKQEICPQGFDLFFGPGAQLTGRKGRRIAVLAALDASRLAPGAGHLVESRHRGIPVALLQFLAKPLHPGSIILQHRRVGRVGGIIPGSCAGSRLQQCLGPPRAGQCRRQQLPAPGCLLGRRILLPQRCKFLQRLSGMG